MLVVHPSMEQVKDESTPGSHQLSLPTPGVPGSGTRACLVGDSRTGGEAFAASDITRRSSPTCSIPTRAGSRPLVTAPLR